MLFLLGAEAVDEVIVMAELNRTSGGRSTMGIGFVKEITEEEANDTGSACRASVPCALTLYAPFAFIEVQRGL